MNKTLLTDFLQIYAFQPATALWRAVEVDVLRRYLPSTGKTLDLGCGDGKLTVLLFGKAPLSGLTLVGIDGDPDETAQAARYPLYARIQTCWASSIPEPASSFDHAISNSVLEHIEDIEATLTEAARLLKPGGDFVFTVPGAGFHNCLRGPLLPGVSRQTYLRELDKRLAHCRYWSVDEWRAALERHGLRLEQTEEYLTCAETRRWESISRFTAGILFALTGNRKRPIEVQKALGLRQAQNRFNLPRPLARLLAEILALGIRSTAQGYGCLLIQARKP